MPLMTIANNISYDIADSLMERPVGFSFGSQHFCLYPLTLGHIQLITRLADNLGLSSDTNSNGVLKIITKSAKVNHDTCLRIVAYASLQGRECLNETLVARRVKMLRKLKPADLATLVTYVLTQDKTDKLIKHFHLDLDKKRLDQAVKVKERSGGTLSFGGKSLWGTVIDFACERYGWTLDYVVWGISYCNLQMLMADHVKTIFLTDKEAKASRVSTDGVVIDTKDTQALREVIKNTSWR